MLDILSLCSHSPSLHLNLTVCSQCTSVDDAASVHMCTTSKQA